MSLRSPLPTMATRGLHRLRPRRRMGTGALFLLSLALFGLWSLHRAPAAAAQSTPSATVAIVDFDYDQHTTTVPLGTTVTWNNTGGRPHTVTDRGGTFDTQPIDPGGAGSVTPTAPGTYFYFCRINPSKMNGVLVVTAGAKPAPIVRVQTIDPANIEGETLRFDPPKIEVAVGTTLQVANVGGKQHSLSAEDGSFSTGIIQPGPEAGRFAGSSATITLNKPGTYNFFCDIHPAVMKGTVFVTGAAPAGTAPTGTAAATTAPPGTSPPPTAAATKAATSAEVAIADFEFKAPQISVGPGAEVTFRNTGDAPHTATFDDVQLDTATLESGASAKLVAPLKPGSYSYFCAIHKKMRGVLVVLGENTPDPVKATSTTAAAAPPSSAAPTTSAAAPSGAKTETAAAVTTPAKEADSGPGSSMTIWIVLTLAVGFFLGGAGLVPLLARRRKAG